MVWGGRIYLTARTELVFLRGGNLTSDHYIREILSDQVSFLLMEDNTRRHVACVVQYYLHEVVDDIETLDCRTFVCVIIWVDNFRTISHCQPLLTALKT